MFIIKFTFEFKMLQYIFNVYFDMTENRMQSFKVAMIDLSKNYFSQRYTAE